MRKLILHIGTEKTGTTTLQEFLDVNRENLVKKGFYFLKSPGKKNNRALPSICMFDEKFDDFFYSRSIFDIEEKKKFEKKFLKEINEEIRSIPNFVHTVISSSEHCHSRLTHEEEVLKLKSILSKYFDDIKIVVYLRPQVDVAISLYSTALKSGNAIEFKDFIYERCVENSKYYNYFELLTRWDSVFGEGAVIPKIFKKDEFYNEDLLDDFSCILGEDLIGYLDKSIINQNESIDHFGQCLTKSINKHIPRIIRGVGENKDNLKITNKIINSSFGKGISLNKEEYIEIQSRFDKSNKLVKEKYFHERDSLFDLSVPSSDNRILTSDQEYLLDEVISLLVDFDAKGWLHSYIDVIRDSALLLEKVDFQKAYQLMSLASILRPDGGFIKKKIKEYESEMQKMN